MIECAVYHAEIPLNKRNDVHENFVKDKLQVVVATVAFGMGIDKPGNYYYFLIRTVLYIYRSRPIS